MILQQKQFDIPEIGVLTVLWATVDTLLNTTKEGTTAARQIRQTSQQTQFWWKRIKILSKLTYFEKQYQLPDTQPFLMFLTINTFHLIINIFQGKSRLD